MGLPFFYTTSEKVSTRVDRVTEYAIMSLGNFQVKIPYSNCGLCNFLTAFIILVLML